MATGTETAGRAVDAVDKAPAPRKSHLTRTRVRAAWMFLIPMLIVLLARHGRIEGKWCSSSTSVCGTNGVSSDSASTPEYELTGKRER